MAERRMFAKSITGSARFLRMPVSSRLLYYDLGMAADDDGVVEAFSILRLSGATEDDLRVLVSKNFVQVLNDDLVSVILDWKQNNQIRPDRYKPSIYADLLKGLPLGIPDGNQAVNQAATGRDTSGKPRLGKGRIGKDRSDNFVEEEEPCFLLPGVGNELQAAFSSWLKYKEERNQKYKPTGLQALAGEVVNNAKAYGEEAVVSVIRWSMASNYKGIIFDKLAQQSGRGPMYPKRPTEDPNRDKSEDDFLAYLAKSGVEV